MNRLDRMKEFYNTLSIENVDLAYFASTDHESTDDFYSAIEDGDGFNIDIIYWHKAMEYLMENDTSLRESLDLAADMGYELASLSSEALASLHASNKVREEFEELRSEIDDFFEELNSDEEE